MSEKTIVASTMVGMNERIVTFEDGTQERRIDNFDGTETVYPVSVETANKMTGSWLYNPDELPKL